MSFAASAVKAAERIVRQAPKVAQRGFQTSKRSAEGYHEDYIHAPHMYTITEMKARKLKFGTGIVALVSIGVGIPVFAVWWTQKKAGA